MAGTLKVDAPGADALSTSADDSSARVGTVLAGRYLLHRVLGEGGMGAVYEAENTVTGRRVAIKVMLPRAAKVDTAPERFLREARAASRVAHPNIVDVLDAGQNPSDGTWYIVQELLEGSELRALLEARGSLPLTEALALLTPVMDALAAAHRRGIVHRDVKPENIFLARTPTGVVPKLIDFGIARLVDGDGPMHLTRSGALLGTPCYMSPEQARGLKDIDARADVWAMGVVLREVLTGHRPFAGDNYNAMMVSILSAPVAPTVEVVPDAPPHIAAALDRALARDPAERFHDMSEMLDALKRNAPEALAQTAPGVTLPAAARGRPLWSVVAAAALVFTGLAAWRVSSPRPSPPPSLPPRTIAAPPADVVTVPDPPPPPPAVVEAPDAAAPAATAMMATKLPPAPRRVVRRAVRTMAGAPDAAATNNNNLIRSLHGQ